MEPNHLITKYKQHVLEEGAPPASVFKFSKGLGVSERQFFDHFASFEALEASIWQQLVADTITAIRAGKEWQGFTAQQKLLTFYYAFFENALDERSLLLLRFPRWKCAQSSSSQLGAMKREFNAFAAELITEGTENNEVACRGKINHTYPTALFGHFLSAIEFNLTDDSPRFERTDAFIEKSVRLAFDLITSNALESAFDLVRFLTGRHWEKNTDTAS
jgi:AcrR family transcriptional regulator